MTVNGISGSSYQYQNMLNLIRLSGTGRSSGHQAVSPVKRVSSATSSSKAAYEDIQNFLKDYQSKLTGLETAALKLTESSSKNVWNDYQVTTTDSSVAVASASYRLKGDTDITLNVQSLAQTQQNASASHHAQEQVDPGADMEFELTGPEGGTISVAVGSVNENGTAKTYHQMYQEAAGTINAQSGAGVRASVSNVDGRVSLVLTSAREGEAGGFTVSGATGAASGIEDAAVRAQDAVYTVIGNGSARTLRSDSNKISLDYGRIEAELKGTGEARVYTGIDEDTVVFAVEDLVKSYNEVSGLLKDNGDRGTGAASHLASFGRGMADAKTLKAVGITYNKDGKLELDKDTLKNALETDLEGTKSLLGGQFGMAEKAARRAESALSDPVQRIVDSDLAAVVSKREQETSSANFRYLSNFARSGPYNMTNFYTVGLLFNTLA